jgi:hypothetical protein
MSLRKRIAAADSRPSSRSLVLSFLSLLQEGAGTGLDFRFFLVPSLGFCCWSSIVARFIHELLSLVSLHRTTSNYCLKSPYESRIAHVHLSTGSSGELEIGGSQQQLYKVVDAHSDRTNNDNPLRSRLLIKPKRTTSVLQLLFSTYKDAAPRPAKSGSRCSDATKRTRTTTT